MIKFIAFAQDVTFPNGTCTSTLNVAEQSKRIRVEETADGFLFSCGAADEKGNWKESGLMEVRWPMVKYVTRDRTPVVQAKTEQKK
jgi:hypothetical protein